MSSSTQNDRPIRRSLLPFRPTQHPLSLSFLPEGITLKEFGIIKLTAQFTAVYDLEFRLALKKKTQFDSKFQFLNKDDDKVYFKEEVSHMYVRVLKRSQKLRMTCANLAPVFEGLFNLINEVEEGVEMSVVDFHAVEFFYNMEYDSPQNLSMIIKPPQMQHSPPQKLLSFALLSEGVTVTRKEVDIIKLTAQFVAVYGTCFLQDLMKKRSMKEFQFVKPGDRLFTFYQRICLVCSTVLLQTEELDANMTSIVEDFLSLLEKIPKEDVEVEEVEMGMTDVRTFLRFVHNEYAYSRSPPGYISVIPEMQLPLGSQDDDDDAERYLQPLRLPLRYGLVYQGTIILPREFDTIKITAEFAAEHGIQLVRDLLKSVFTEKTQFESLFKFMNSSTDDDSRHKLYGGFVLERKKALWKQPSNDGVCSYILEGCFCLIRQVLVNEVEAGMEMAVNDLHDFDSSVNKWRMMMNQTPQMQPPLGSHQFGLEEPDPMRQTLDESTL